ncbi:MAG: 50S ribosomal protein L22 [Candidatus Paceibacterota bacterium]
MATKVKKENKTVKAKLSYLKISPRKVRQVANMVKGLHVNEAEAQLLLSSRRPSIHLLKLLKSAVANAINNEDMMERSLYIKTIMVNEGPVLKRGLPRARGSMDLIQKRMSHVVLELEEKTPKTSKFVIPEKQEKQEKPVDNKKKSEEDGSDSYGAKDALNQQDDIKAKKPKSPNKKFFRRKSV